MYDPNNGYNQHKKNNNSNTAVIVTISILSVIIIVSLIFLALQFSGYISMNGRSNASENIDTSYISPTPVPEEVVKEVSGTSNINTVPVNADMFIGNCKKSVTLRVFPSTSSDELCQIPLGDSIYVVEYLGNNFAKVYYNYYTGYVLSDYIVSNKPNVYVAPKITTTPVQRTMYIGKCNTSVTLRSSHSVDSNAMCQIPLGDSIYVIEYTSNNFALVTYNGLKGYVLKDYVVSSAPDYTYKENISVSTLTVENFVSSSLEGFVNGINTGDTSYITTYFASGSAYDQELASHKSIRSIVESEEILSQSCEFGYYIDPHTVTAVRDSTIRVTYKDGTVKDITESYMYTMSVYNGILKIISLEEQ